MNDYKTTMTKFAIHRTGDNPVFGEGVIHVSLDDEGGGSFLVLEQESQKIRITLEELELLVAEAKRLVEGAE